VRRRGVAALCDNLRVVARRLLVMIVPLLIVAATAGALLARYLHPESAPPALTSGTWLPAGRDIAPVELLDQDARPFTPQQLRGHPSLLFFGFTHCPDVCPTTLALLAGLTRSNALPGLQTVFVTVDPQRDDPASMKRYVAAFGANLTGVTGPAAQLERLMKSVGVASLRRDLPGGDYTMDHSATLFLLDSQARIAAIFTPPLTLPALQTDLRLAAAALVGPAAAQPAAALR
jgi:protein SCO1/2